MNAYEHMELVQNKPFNESHSFGMLKHFCPPVFLFSIFFKYLLRLKILKNKNKTKRLTASRTSHISSIIILSWIAVAYFWALVSLTWKAYRHVAFARYIRAWVASFFLVALKEKIIYSKFMQAKKKFILTAYWNWGSNIEILGVIAS